MTELHDRPLPTRDRLEELLGQFADKRVLLVGDAAADVYIEGRTIRLSREAPVPIIRETRRFTVPGQAGNVAINLASLGAEVELACLLGDEPESDALREALEAKGVSLNASVTWPGYTIPTKTRLLAGAPHTRLQQVVRLDREPEKAPDTAIIDQLLGKLKYVLPNAQAVIASDYGYDTVSGEVWKWLRAETEKRGIPLILDSRHRLGELKNADLITPNEQEAVALAAWDDSSDVMDASTLGRVCQELSKAKTVLLKRGNQGMHLFQPADDSPVSNAANLRESAFGVFGPADAVDVSGAGDTVVATVTLGKLAGGSWEEASHLANIAAGLTVQRMGACATTPDEMRHALADWPQDLR
jgi:rfaE bifunctional protein kinase chain/domain